jgi:hypothetical protein
MQCMQLTKPVPVRSNAVVSSVRTTILRCPFIAARDKHVSAACVALHACESQTRVKYKYQYKYKIYL